MTEAPTEQKGRRAYQKHGTHTRDRRLRLRGLAGLDARTHEGKEALAWRDAALKAKGGAACSYALKVEIKLACFDLWRLLCLQAWLIADATARSTIINRRKRELPRIHEQYDQIDGRFMRRVEALDLGKVQPMDLARRLQLAQATADQR